MSDESGRNIEDIPENEKSSTSTKKSASRHQISENDEGFATESSAHSTPKKSSGDVDQKSKNTRISRKTNSRKPNVKQQTDTDSDMSTNESQFECYARTTRSGNAALKLLKRIEDIISQKEDLNFDSLTCIVCCDKKNTILLPCRHQHTCESCGLCGVFSV